MAGAVDTTYTFTSTDVITSTKLNDILDQSVMTGTAIIGTTLEVTTSGKLKVASQGITSNELGNNSVKTIAIEDGAVTPAKLANSDFGDFTVTSGSAILDNNVVTTAKILDANITTTKIADANITAAKLDGAQTGSAPIYGVRAWVTFNGITSADKAGTYSRTASSTTATISMLSHGLSTGHRVFIDFASGTADGIYEVTKVDANTFTITTVETTAQSGIVATVKLVTILASGNIAYVGRASTQDGRYIVGFTQDMPDSDYALFGSAEDSADTDLNDLVVGRPYNGLKTTKSVYITVADSGNVGRNSPSVSSTFIR